MSARARLNYIFAAKAYQQRLGRLTGIVLLTRPLRTTNFATLQRKILEYARSKEERWISTIDALQKTVKDPSHARDLINWATKLDIISEGKHKWTWKGRVLNTLTPQTQKDAFLKGNTSLSNPFELTNEQILFFLYILLQADGLFLVLFLEELSSWKEFRLSSGKDFQNEDIRIVYRNVWNKLAEKLKKSSSYSRRKEGKILEKRIEKLAPRSLYIKALTKLEALVDLKLLKRLSEHRAHYLPLKKKLQTFSSFPPLEELARKNRLESFLEKHFFHIASRIYDMNEEISGSNHPMLLERYLAQSYLKLTSKGWKIIKRNELNLLTSIMALTQRPHLILEPTKIAGFQLELSEKYGPKQIQLFGDYEGKLSSIKIESSTIEKMLGS